MGVLQIGIRAMVIEDQYDVFSQTRSTSDIDVGFFHQWHGGVLTSSAGVKRTRFVLSVASVVEEDRVKFATGTLTNDAMSWWNAYAQPIRIEQANKITWTELKRTLEPIELAVLCPNMVPNFEKLMEAFIGGLPQSIEGNVTASKPQTLEEATNIAHRLMDQIIKHDFVQETNDHKQKFKTER
ncbi:hypothetical protein Tco_0512639 [Tanacetum coccineum]